MQRDSNESQGWTPAFESQRPPFQPGNQVAVKHGSYAVVKLAPRAREIADELRPSLPVYSPADEPVLALLSLTLARVEVPRLRSRRSTRRRARAVSMLTSVTAQPRSSGCAPTCARGSRWPGTYSRTSA